MQKLHVIPNHPDDTAAAETVRALLTTVLENNTVWVLDDRGGTSYIYCVYGLDGYIQVRSESDADSESLYYEDHRDRHLLQMKRFFERTTA